MQACGLVAAVVSCVLGPMYATSINSLTTCRHKDSGDYYGDIEKHIDVTMRCFNTYYYVDDDLMWFNNGVCACVSKLNAECWWYSGRLLTDSCEPLFSSYRQLLGAAAALNVMNAGLVFGVLIYASCTLIAVPSARLRRPQLVSKYQH
jgi:hypothetical protein